VKARLTRSYSYRGTPNGFFVIVRGDGIYGSHEYGPIPTMDQVRAFVDASKRSFARSVDKAAQRVKDACSPPAP
jgi:hypothetical protein